VKNEKDTLLLTLRERERERERYEVRRENKGDVECFGKVL
jgi:hypothetical protein